MNGFVRSFAANNIMRVRYEELPDSLRAIAMPYKVDSVFERMSHEQQQVVVERALNTARTAKSYVNASMDEFRYKRRVIARHGIEWHRKFSLSFACLVFFLIGAPLGAIICKGGLGVPMLVSVIFFVVYYVITITGEKFAGELLWTPAMGMWLSSMVLFAFGAFLSYKSTTDASLMSAEAYREFFKRMGRGVLRVYNCVFRRSQQPSC